MRGKLRKNLALNATVRITPAGAGKTGFLLPPPEAGRDHPRRCGENPRRQADRVELPVSPPQVRGKPSPACQTSSVRRITPAGAGKTLVEHPRRKTNRNHPRRCGENRHQFRHPRRRKGSPPQVRGKPAALNQTALCPGITPAGAGKTSAKDTKLIVA